MAGAPVMGRAVARVMVVEGETKPRRAMVMSLRAADFDVVGATDFPACRAVIRRRRFEAVVLNLGLAPSDELAFTAELRGQGDIALVIVSRSDAPEARIAALDLGADDYMVKPLHYGELAARLRSVLRRRRSWRGPLKQLGRWLVDVDARTVTCGVEAPDLTQGEFAILLRLIVADGQIVSREELMQVTSRRPLEADIRSIDALVSRLRHKLGDPTQEARLILTTPGSGYRLTGSATDA